MNSDLAIPTTRWATPPPWQVTAATAPAAEARAAKRSQPGALAPSSTGVVLLNLLQDDLRSGHRRAAVRHFLMARACGAFPPTEVQEECERLLLAFPHRARVHIEHAVRCWTELVVPPEAQPNA